jgi:hypothetical protein
MAGKICTSMRPFESASTFSAQGSMKKRGTEPIGDRKCWQRSVTSAWALAAPALTARDAAAIAVASATGFIEFVMSFLPGGPAIVRRGVQPSQLERERAAIRQRG